MRGRHIILVMIAFLLSLLVGAILNVPAVQLLRFVQLPQHIAIAGVEGTVTHGKIGRILVQGYPVSELSFNFKPACLLKLALCYRLTSDEDEILLNLERSLLGQSTYLTDSYAAIPNSIFLKIPNLLVKPSGDFSVKVRELQINDARKLEQLSALVEWNNAGIEGEKQVLGNYTADISTSSGGVEVTMSDRDSLLGMKGSVNMNWRGQYETDLEFEHQSGLNPSLISVLEMSAQKSGLNRFRMKKKGVLPPNILRQIGSFLPNNNRQ